MLGIEEDTFFAFKYSEPSMTIKELMTALLIHSRLDSTPSTKFLEFNYCYLLDPIGPGIPMMISNEYLSKGSTESVVRKDLVEIRKGNSGNYLIKVLVRNAVESEIQVHFKEAVTLSNFADSTEYSFSDWCDLNNRYSQIFGE